MRISNGSRRGAALAAALLASCLTASAHADEPDPRGPALVRPVPPPPPPPVPRTSMNCVGCVIAGGIVLGTGAAHALVGGMDVADAGSGDERSGRVLLVLAGLHAVVGLPLLIAGVWPVEHTGARASLEAPAEPAVDVAVGPQGGALRLRF